MEKSEFVWNKKLAANIGKMAEIAGEYMEQFPKGAPVEEPYDPSKPLVPNWDALTQDQKDKLSMPIGGPGQILMHPEDGGALEWITPPANDLTEEEVAALKVLAMEKNAEPEKVEHGASTVKALVKDAVQAAVGFLGEVGIYVKDMDANMHPGEIPTVTLVLDALGPVKNVKQGYLTVAALIEAVHEVKK